MTIISGVVPRALARSLPLFACLLPPLLLCVARLAGAQTFTLRAPEQPLEAIVRGGRRAHARSALPRAHPCQHSAAWARRGRVAARRFGGACTDERPFACCQLVDQQPEGKLITARIDHLFARLLTQASAPCSKGAVASPWTASIPSRSRLATSVLLPATPGFTIVWFRGGEAQLSRPDPRTLEGP